MPKKKVDPPAQPTVVERVVPLYEYTTEALIEELRRRSVGMLITLATTGEGNNDQYRCWWKGSMPMMYSVQAFTAEVMQREARRQQQYDGI